MSDKKKPSTPGGEAGVATRKALSDAVAAAARITQPFALGGSLLAPIIATAQTPVGGALARDFARGLITGQAAPATVQRVAAQPARAPAGPSTEVQAVRQALVTQGQQQITPQERAMSAINAILERPHTLQEFQAAAGALPGVAASAAGKQSNKDKVFGTVAGIYDTLYRTELDAAMKLPEAQRDAAVLKVTEKYGQNLSGLVGTDPSKQALAMAMQQAAEE